MTAGESEDVIRLRLLGSLDLKLEDGRSLEAVLSREKRFGLLAFLASTYPPAFHHYDRLTALFWPDRNARSARQSLRQSLYRIRQWLGPDVIEGRGRSSVRIDPDSVWCDAAELKRHVEAECWTEVVALYTGCFLEGYESAMPSPAAGWLVEEREHLRSEARDAALTLALGATTSEETKRWLQRGRAIVPADEHVARELMRVFGESGNRGEALQVYRRLSRYLEFVFGTAPSQETRSLAEAIRERRSTSCWSETSHPGGN